MDWDIRGQDIDQRYAKFGHRPISESEAIGLSMANIVANPSGIADLLFLTSRSCCEGFANELRDWGLMVADGLAKSLHKPRHGTRRRQLVEGYTTTWGTQAVLDGLTLAMFSKSYIGTTNDGRQERKPTVPGLTERARQFKCGAQAYQRIRDCVGGAAATVMEEYRYGLMWAHGYVRDRTFEFRFWNATGLKWDGENSPVISGVGEEESPAMRLSSGCYVKPSLGSERSSDDANEPEVDWHQPGFHDRGFWDERNAPPIERKPFRFSKILTLRAERL